MKQMINGYVQSCERVRSRIEQLTAQKNELSRQGRADLIGELDLERRIRLLYAEQSQIQETIDYLTGYMRRVEQRAET